MAAFAAPALAARLELPLTVAPPGGRLRYDVVNTGTIPILVGPTYGLERLVAAGWEEVEVPYWFAAIGLPLDCDARLELTARIPEAAKSGRHRLRVRLLADPAAARGIEPIEVTAEFDVASV